MLDIHMASHNKTNNSQPKMSANMVHQEQRVVSPPQARCGSSKMCPANASASVSDGASPPMPSTMRPHHMNQTPGMSQEHPMKPHYPSNNSMTTSAATWGGHRQGCPHPHAPPPPMRYSHHPTNMPPPPPPSSSFRGRGCVHDEFIFQAGPPRQPYLRLPPHDNQHPQQQQHAYHYSGAPSSVPPRGAVNRHPMPPRTQHVTPQFKRSVVSRGSSVGSHTSTPPCGAPTSTLEGGESTHGFTIKGEKKEKLAPVDAIFAAAEVIAQRPSPSSLNGGVFTSSQATTPKPKRPFKKRKVATPSNSTPSPNNKKVKKASGTKKKSRSASQSISPEHDRALSERALFLSQTIEAEPGLYRELLLHMALQRETPRKQAPTATGGVGTPDSSGSKQSSSCVTSASTTATPAAAVSPESNFPEVIGIGKRRGNQYVEGVRTFAGDSSMDKVITDGFFWKDVPELESILQRFMEEYYEMSENRPQSKKQQQFNNRLVNIIHKTALQSGYTFDPLSFGSSGSPTLTQPPSDSTPSTLSSNDSKCNSKELGDNFNYKKLRDRIRCYYKTHVQNSKKRLITLLKNPTRPKNREVLIKIVEDVKARAVSDYNGSGRKLSPNGKAALKRLEARENGYDPDLQQTNGFVVPSIHMATTPESAQSVPDQQAVVAHSSAHSSYSTHPPTGTSSDTTTMTTGWHPSPSGPPTPRRVSMKAGDYNCKPTSSNRNAEPPVFASPCKPEHVAMLQSIRQVSVPRQIL